jgi:hypothetical protein
MVIIKRDKVVSWKERLKEYRVLDRFFKKENVALKTQMILGAKFRSWAKLEGMKFWLGELFL